MAIKAIVKLSPDVPKGQGWGVTLKDSIGNKYSLHYSKGFIEVPVDVAKQFEGNPSLIIEYPDGTTFPVTKKDVSKSEPTKPESKENKLTEKEVWDMTKSEQTELLKKFNAKKIPKLEKGRVKLILKLQ